MAVVAADLRLNAAALWPGESPTKLDERLGGYLTAAAAKAAALETEDVDAGTIAWARYLAFDDVYQRLMALPSSVTDSDEGASSYLVTQIQMMKDERDAALAEFTGLEAEVDAPTESNLQPRGSAQSRINFAW